MSNVRHLLKLAAGLMEAFFGQSGSPTGYEILFPFSPYP